MKANPQVAPHKGVSSAVLMKAAATVVKDDSHIQREDKVRHLSKSSVFCCMKVMKDSKFMPGI